MGAIQAWYDRHLMPRLVTASCGMRHIAEQRAQIVPAAAGIVLEVGIGPGHNLALYDPSKVKRVIGADPSLEMTERGSDLIKRAVSEGVMKAPALAVPYANLAAMHRALGNGEEAASFSSLAKKMRAPNETKLR